MGRIKGAKHKHKPWKEALRRALYERPHKGGPRNLDLVAKAAVAEALRGKAEIIRELGDRIDGKVPQALVGDENEAAIRVIARIERTIVKPS